MRKQFIRWLLGLLGHPVDTLPGLTVYAVAPADERIAQVTTNYNRARALALETRAKEGRAVIVYKCVPISAEKF